MFRETGQVEVKCPDPDCALTWLVPPYDRQYISDHYYEKHVRPQKKHANSPSE